MTKIAQPTKPLADVNVLPQGDGSHKLVVCFMPNMARLYGEGIIRAFLAIDGSASMRVTFGPTGPFFDRVPNYVDFFDRVPNYVERVSKKIGKILSAVASPAKTLVFYWAVGHSGDRIEMIGEFDEMSWDTVKIQGPQQEKWGRATNLLPCIKYGWESVFPGSQCTIGVIITDGIIEDAGECIDYCLQIAQQSKKQGPPNPFKLINIAFGDEPDEGQLTLFDDLYEETLGDLNIFSHISVRGKNEEAEIWDFLLGQLLIDNVIIEPNGRVEDSKGNVLISWSDGMPGKFEFILPKGEKQFTIKAPDLHIVQDVAKAIP